MKARVWIDNDNSYLYIEVETPNGVLTHDEWGQHFTRRYVENIIAYLYGECTIEFM